MATGRKTVAPGQTIASDWGNLVWDQSVQTFANAAARTTQFPSPKPGAMSYLEDTKRLEIYTGSAWVGVGPNTIANWGAVVWGTYSNKPVDIRGGFVETAVSAASGFDIAVNTGVPWTCILAVSLAGAFKYNAAPYVNSIPLLNRNACVGTATGGVISATMCKSDLTGVGSGVITGLSWTVTFQQ